MITSIDQNQDFSSKELYTYLRGVDLPEFVKSAELDSAYSRDEVLEKSAYADTAGHFPINSAVRTYVSNAFFVNKKAALKKEKGEYYVNLTEKNLQKAAEIWNIQTDIEAYNKVAEARNSKSFGDHSVVVKHAGDEIQLFTIQSPNELSVKAAHFVANLRKYPYEWRRNISEQFVKAAMEYGVDELPDLVLKYAGQYYPDLGVVEAELKRRKTKLPKEAQERYDALISDLPNTSSLDDFFKLAETCYFIEKNAGLYEKTYERQILGDVVDRMFTLHFDKVAEMLDYVEMGGEKFHKSDLEKVSSDVFEQAFGFSLDPKEADFKDVARTLPLSDVALFKQLSGLKPL